MKKVFVSIFAILVGATLCCGASLLLTGCNFKPETAESGEISTPTDPETPEVPNAGDEGKSEDENDDEVESKAKVNWDFDVRTVYVDNGDSKHYYASAGGYFDLYWRYGDNTECRFGTGAFTKNITTEAAKGKTVGGGGEKDNYCSNLSFFHMNWGGYEEPKMVLLYLYWDSNYEYQYRLFGMSKNLKNSECRTPLDSETIRYFNGNGIYTYSPGATTTMTGVYNIVYRKVYSNTYILNGGSGISTSQTTYAGITFNLHGTPTRSGYTFAGWKEGDGSMFTANYTFPDSWADSSKTFTAQWTANTYTITYSANISGVNINMFNRSIVDRGNLSYNASTNRHYASSNDNYANNIFSYLKFQMYSNGAYGYEIINTTQIGISSARFTKTSTSTHLRYGFNGNAEDKTSMINISDLANGEYTLQVEMYSFSSTYGEFGNIKIEKSTYKTAYSPPKENINYGSTYGTLPTLTRDGYTFSGWYTSSSGGTKVTSTSTYSTAGGQTLYARWEIKTYTLTIKYFSRTATNATNLNISSSSCTVSSSSIALNGTSTVSHTYSTASYGVEIARANSSANYYLRHGSAPTTSSYNGVNFFTYNWQPTLNVSINIYVFERYAISFDRNNASSGTFPYPIYKIHGTAATIPDNDLNRIGYTANGWNTNKDGTGTDYAAGSYSANSNLQLYAKWTANQYTVSFDPLGGSAVAPKTVTYDSTYGTLPSSTRVGANFDGWYKDANFTTAVTAGTTVKTPSNHTLYAKWAPGDGNILKYEQTHEVDLITNVSVDSPTVYSFSSESDDSEISTRSTDFYLDGKGFYCGTDGSSMEIRVGELPYGAMIAHFQIYFVDANSTSVATIENRTFDTSYIIPLGLVHQPYNEGDRVTISYKGQGTFRVKILFPNFTVLSGSSEPPVQTKNYGFKLNSQGYYESQNKAEANSYALCRVSFTVKQQTQLVFTVVQSSESEYDFGIFGNLNQSLSRSMNIDSSYFRSLQNYGSSTYSIAYSVSPGDHFIEIKYRKNSILNENLDKLTFKFEIPKQDAGYFYFEDGEYPQTYVGDSLNSTLNQATSTELTKAYDLTYFDGNENVDMTVYTYKGQKYAYVTNGSVSKWFKVEPIRWRVSEYGVSSTDYPSGWENYGAYNTNFTVVSDKILGFGAVTNQDTKEGWSVTESVLHENILDYSNKIKDTTSLKFETTADIKFDKFGAVGQQDKVERETKSYLGIRVASVEDVKTNLTDIRAKASDMVKFLLGLSSEWADYWTRDLGNNLDNGIVVTKSGIEKSTWLNQMKGVRFAMTMNEGLRI